MPRLIFKCPYIRGGGQRAVAHLKNYVRYVATRPGVEHLRKDQSQQPATKKQQKLVMQVLRDFPLSRGMFEYEDYRASPTQANASEFISRALEENLDRVAKKENYLQYIAQRPNVQHVGSHGLFTGNSETLALSEITETVAHHLGNVWLPIISLRREDAARLGYDDVDNWQALLSSCAMEIADAMKIPRDRFRWYAAFHDQDHHPHIHMVCYSADPKYGYLNREGIAQIKSMLADQMFRQELNEIYFQQTQRRDELTQKAGAVMDELIQQMQTGTLNNERVDQLLSELAEKLRHTSGKKQYGYLKASLKSVVDEIVDELAKDPRVASAYDLWYELREEVLRTYKDTLPERLPLSRQKEFKRIKNLVIEEAVRLGELREVFQPQADVEPEPVPEEVSGEEGQEPPPETDTKEVPPHVAYRLGKKFQDGIGVEKDVSKAVEWFARAAEGDNSFAAYALGKLFLEGDGVKKDLPLALEWFRFSAELGNQHAQYRLGKLLLQGDDVPRDVDEAVHWLRESAEQGNQYAQYALGKLHLFGKDIPEDREKAVRWFTQSAAQGNEHARYFLDHMNDWLKVSQFQSAARLLHHMGNIFQEKRPAAVTGARMVDRKLRQKMRDKRLAMGHKEDDHEDQNINSQSM